MEELLSELGESSGLRYGRRGAGPQTLGGPAVSSGPRRVGARCLTCHPVRQTQATDSSLCSPHHATGGGPTVVPPGHDGPGIEWGSPTAGETLHPTREKKSPRRRERIVAGWAGA